MALKVVILAAGNGNRMHSSLPKVLHRLAGVPLLEHVVSTAQALSPEAIYAIHGNGGDQVRNQLGYLDVQWVEQKKQLGTGHAVMQALPYMDDNDRILVLYGDVPLISRATLQNLLDEIPAQQLGILTANFTNPDGFGRIIRNASKHIVAIVEHKDASPEQRQINEINTGIITTVAKNLKDWLPKLSANNAQGEYYLTDIASLAVSDQCPVASVTTNIVAEVQGVNTVQELIRLERHYQHQAAQQLMVQGVIITDPKRFDLRGELQAGKEVNIDINVILEGKVKLGNNVKIGANTYLRNVTVADNVQILANCYIEDATIETEAVIGPYARIRPGTKIGVKAQIGNFAEIKNVTFGPESKCHHVSYLGDATIGKRVNIGAGTIICNYDGANKHHTTIEDGAFIGSNSQLIAPVTIGKSATIAAGSTVSQYAPANKLTIARSKQRTVPGWQRPKKKK